MIKNYHFMHKYTTFSYFFLLTIIFGLSFNSLTAQDQKRHISSTKKATNSSKNTKSSNAGAQSKAAIIESCSPYSDSIVYSEMTISEAGKWCQLTPPIVKCNDDKEYRLNTFEFTMIIKEPFMTKSYGIGIGGVPFLGVKAVENAKPGDTILIKEVTYLGDDKKEQKLPNIVFRLK